MGVLGKDERLKFENDREHYAEENKEGKLRDQKVGNALSHV